MAPPTQENYGATPTSELTKVQPPRTRTPWDSAAWITATLLDEQGQRCPCPPGCAGDCAVRSHWLFNEKDNDLRTIHTLQSTSNPPMVSLNAGNVAPWGKVAQVNASSYRVMGGCPPSDQMDCIACDTGAGYYPVVYAGDFSIEGIKQTGAGISCYYLEICDNDDSCDTQIAMSEVGTLVGSYAGLFSFLLILFVMLRKIVWLRMAIDSAAWVEKGNPKYPPREIQIPKPREDSAWSWLYDAYHRDNNWMKEFTTPDEYMLVRWFKLSSRFFFTAGAVCCPILMSLYAADTVPSADAGSKILTTLEKSGIAKYTLLNARTESSFAAAMAFTWITSLFLISLIRVESRKYVHMMWTVDPDKTGIKANAILVKDMPLLTTAPAPKKFEQLNTGSVKDILKVKKSVRGSVKKLDKIFDDEEVGCLGRFKLLLNDGTVQSSGDSAKLRLLYKEESMNLVISKFESVLGKDCIAFKMLASDTRKLDSAAKAWANAREHVTQNMQAIADLQETEKTGGLSWGESTQLAKALKDMDSLKRAEAQRFDVFISTRDEYINNHRPACSAVVVFARQMDAVIASQIQIDDVPGQWVTEPAPGNSDVVWHNLSLTSVERAKKTTQAFFIAVAISLFFMYPVNIAVAAVADVKDSLVSVFGESIYNIILSIVLTVFLVVGHILSLVVSRQTGYVSVSAMDSFGASMYFWLLILNLVFSNLNTTPLWKDVLVWMQKPHLFTYQFILRLMNTSTFFLQFVMLRTATSPVLELIHPPVLLGFVTKCLLYRSRARTWPAFAKRLIWAQPTPTPSHRVPAQTMLVFFIGIIYTVVAPVLLPVCGVFFGFFYIFWKHNMVYHYIQQYSAGTSMWAWLVGKMYFSLVFSQIMVAFGLPTLGFNTMKYRVFIIPLVLFTVLEWSRVNTILNDAFRVPVHAAGAALKRRSGKHEEDSDDEYFASGSTSDVPALEEDARQEIFVSTTRIGDSRKRKVMRGIVPVEEMKKSTRRQKNILENTREQGKAEIEYKVKKGIWQTYAPSVLWPLAAEKSAGSIFLRRWKQIKARKQVEADMLAAVAHLPDDDQRKKAVIKDLALRKQVRDSAAEAILRKSTSPYVKQLRQKRAAEKAEKADTRAGWTK